eukprot:UC4_evm5s575
MTINNTSSSVIDATIAVGNENTNSCVQKSMGESDCSPESPVNGPGKEAPKSQQGQGHSILKDNITATTSSVIDATIAVGNENTNSCVQKSMGESDCSPESPVNGPGKEAPKSQQGQGHSILKDNIPATNNQPPSSKCTTIEENEMPNFFFQNSTENPDHNFNSSAVDEHIAIHDISKIDLTAIPKISNELAGTSTCQPLSPSLSSSRKRRKLQHRSSPASMLCSASATVDKTATHSISISSNVCNPPVQKFSQKESSVAAPSIEPQADNVMNFDPNGYTSDSPKFSYESDNSGIESDSDSESEFDPEVDSDSNCNLEHNSDSMPSNEIEHHLKSSWLGRPSKRGAKYFYKAFSKGNILFKEGDFCLLRNPDNISLPHIGRIIKLYEDKSEKELVQMASIRWFYRPSDTNLPHSVLNKCLSNEIFEGPRGYIEDNYLDALESICYVYAWRNCDKEQDIEEHEFFCRQLYDPVKNKTKRCEEQYPLRDSNIDDRHPRLNTVASSSRFQDMNIMQLRAIARNASISDGGSRQELMDRVKTELNLHKIGVNNIGKKVKFFRDLKRDHIKKICRRVKLGHLGTRNELLCKLEGKFGEKIDLEVVNKECHANNLNGVYFATSSDEESTDEEFMVKDSLSYMKSDVIKGNSSDNITPNIYADRTHDALFTPSSSSTKVSINHSSPSSISSSPPPNDCPPPAQSKSISLASPSSSSAEKLASPSMTPSNLSRSSQNQNSKSMSSTNIPLGYNLVPIVSIANLVHECQLFQHLEVLPRLETLQLNLNRLRRTSWGVKSRHDKE